MNKYEQVVLMSMQSNHALNVTNGDKLRELRKTIPRGYRGWVYIYCTKGKPYIMTQDNKFLATLGIKNQELNGKVIGRFWYDEHDEINGFQQIEKTTNITASTKTKQTAGG